MPKTVRSFNLQTLNKKQLHFHISLGNRPMNQVPRAESTDSQATEHKASKLPHTPAHKLNYSPQEQAAGRGPSEQAEGVQP